MLITSPPENKDYRTFDVHNHIFSTKNRLAKNSITEIVLSKMEHIYRPPDNEGCIYEIVTGAVKLGSYSENGESYIHDVVKKGDFFGNLKYLNGQFFEFAKTIVDSRLRVYDLSFFRSTIVNDPLLADWFISYLLKRWCTSEKKLGNISGNNTEERVRFLKKLFDLKIKDTHGEEFILLELLTHKNLGDLAGATRQTISNILKRME